MKHHDIAVVGLGIVGASAVYAATRAGVRVVALDAADGWLDAPRLIRALLAAVSARGADVRERAPVRSLAVRARRVQTVVAEGGEAIAGSVLVCVGASTQEFLSPLGVSIPVGRVPGLLAVTSPPAQPLRRVVHAPGIHLRPDAGGALVLGAEDVDAPAAEARSPSRLDELAALLLERAAHVVPAARGVKVVDRRVGVRPMPADRHTIAGRLPGFDNIWVVRSEERRVGKECRSGWSA